MATARPGSQPASTGPRIFHKWQTCLLVLAAIAALLCPDSEHTYWSFNNSVSHYVQVNALLVILTALVTISLTFEFMQHNLHHTCTDVFMPVLHALNGELMGLGFLAILFYLVEVRFNTLTNWSVNTVCAVCDPCQGFPTPYHAQGDDDRDDEFSPRRLLEMDIERRLGGGPIPGTGCNFDLCTASYNATVHNMPLHASYDAHLAQPIDEVHFAVNDTTRPTACDQYHPVVEARRFLLDYEQQDPGFLAEHGGLPHFGSHKDVSGAYSDLIFQLPVHARHEAIHGKEAFTAHRRLGGGMTGECWHCDQILLHLFEDVHMTLFLVMVLYFIRSVILIQQTEWQSNKWRSFETILKTTENGEAKTLEKYFSTMKTGGFMAKMKAREFVEYVLLRKRFLKTGSQSGALEVIDFNFAEYLSIILGHSAAHMVHIPPKAWAIMEVVFVIFWACMQAPTETRIRGFMLIALGLLAIMLIVFGKFYTIRDQLLIKIPKLPYEFSTDLVSNLDLLAATPSYLKNKITSSRSGHLTNQQEACFWWGSQGPEFLIHVIRLVNLNMLIFFVLLIFALPYTAANDEQFLVPLIVLIPVMALANFFGPAEMMRVYSIVSSVELLKDPHAIEKTTREVKLARSVRTIKLLRSLKSVMDQKKMVQNMKEKGDVESEGNTPEELNIDWESMSLEERAKADQLKEVFALFDSSNDGSVDIQELGGLMTALGITLEDDDKVLLMKQFDRSGDGSISFAEFYTYMSSRSENVDTRQLVADVFALIDKDGSGAITVEEFEQTLMALPIKISEADINVLVREIDTGGDGEISLHEFADVLNKYK